jgi:hypothetical protein
MNLVKQKTMNREELKAIVEWKQVPNVAIEKALKLNVPSGVFRKLKNSNHQEIKEWRNVAIFCFWLNGATTTEAMGRYGRCHSTFSNSLKNLVKEIEGFDKNSKYLERIRLINYYAKNRIAYCDEDNIQIGDLVVYYRSEFEPSDEECGIVGGWAVDIIEVHGIVESEHLKGGVIEVPINEYDEQSLINEIKNKL